MTKKVFIGLALSVIVLVGAQPARGAGFLIYEHGAASMGMGGAFTAIANDPSAIFYNPAGIAWMDGTQVYTGATFIAPRGSLSLPNWPDPAYKNVDQQNQLFYPPSLYITHKLSDKVVAGFGFFVPYGLGANWPEQYPLKYISYDDDLKTFFFNPTIGFKVSDNFSLGFGASYVHSLIDFKLVEHEVIMTNVDLGGVNPALAGVNAAAEVTLEIPTHFTARGNGFSLNAGALYKGEKFSLGVNWRSGFKIKYNNGDIELGQAEVSADVTIPPPYNQILPAGTAGLIAAGVEAQVASQIPGGGGASTAFNFPHIISVGAAFQATPALLLSFDFQYNMWSTYDEFTVEVDVPGFSDKFIEENWKDSYIIRLGAEYAVSESFKLRIGGGYDPTPQPAEYMDPILPDSDRKFFTLGLGYNSGKFTIDVAYQVEMFDDRTSPNRYVLYNPLLGVNLGEGTYSTTAHLLGISLGFDFSKK